MKKLLLLIVLFITATLQAQEISFGVKAGLNLSYLRIKDNVLVDSKMKSGFHIGGVGEMKVSKLFAIETQLLYSQQNSVLEIKLSAFRQSDSRGSEPVFEEDLEIDYQLGYLNLPILAKIYIIDGFNVFLGPQFCFLVSDKENYDFKNFDYGFMGGLGYQLNSGLFFSANYYYGSSDISNQKIGIKQEVIQISVGYML